MILINSKHKYLMRVRIFLVGAFTVAGFFFLPVQSLLAQTCGTGFESQAGLCIPTDTGLPSAPVLEIVGSLLNWLLAVLGFIAIIAFIISGIQYLVSAGNEKMIETAKRNMTWSIVGVIVALSGLVVLYAISIALSAGSFF